MVFISLIVTRRLPLVECSVHPGFSVVLLQIIVCRSVLKFYFWNRIGGVMVSVLASSAVDHEFESRSGQTKDYKIGLR